MLGVRTSASILLFGPRTLVCARWLAPHFCGASYRRRPERQAVVVRLSVVPVWVAIDPPDSG